MCQLGQDKANTNNIIINNTKVRTHRYDKKRQAWQQPTHTYSRKRYARQEKTPMKEKRVCLQISPHNHTHTDEGDFTLKTTSISHAVGVGALTGGNVPLRLCHLLLSSHPTPVLHKRKIIMATVPIQIEEGGSRQKVSGR